VDNRPLDVPRAESGRGPAVRQATSATIPLRLETVDGPGHEKRPRGLRSARVVSKPADEIRRQALIPAVEHLRVLRELRHPGRIRSARAAGPGLPARPEIDRWILANLHALIAVARQKMEEFDFGRFS